MMAHDQAGDVEHRKRHDLAPGRRVADPPVQRIGPIFGEADDVGRRLAARELAEAGRRSPVPASTMPSQVTIRASNPRSNRSKVSGPGAMKKTKIQIGQ